MTCYLVKAAKLKKISQFKKSLQYLGKWEVDYWGTTCYSRLLGYYMLQQACFAVWPLNFNCNMKLPYLLLE